MSSFANRTAICAICHVKSHAGIANRTAICDLSCKIVQIAPAISDLSWNCKIVQIAQIARIAQIALRFCDLYDFGVILGRKSHKSQNRTAICHRQCDLSFDESLIAIAICAICHAKSLLALRFLTNRTAICTIL